MIRRRRDPNSDIIKKGGKVPANPPPPPSVLDSPPDPPVSSGERYAEERMVYWLQKSNRYREALEDIANQYGDDTMAGRTARLAIGRDGR